MHSRKQYFHFLVFSALVTFSYSESINVGDTRRDMLVHAPDGIEENCPLVISCHGMGQNAGIQQNQTQWNPIADTGRFVVVYPEGTGGSWDTRGDRDIDFIQAIIKEMSTRHNIDTNRVYLSGFSMGGMLTYRAMNTIADKIAAFGPVSGYMDATTASSRPVPIVHVHGSSDQLVPYAPGNSSMTGAFFPGIHSIIEGWADWNGCSATPETTSPYPAGTSNNRNALDLYTDCDDGVEIALISVEGVQHEHSIRTAVHTTKELWNFMKNFSLASTVSTTSHRPSQKAFAPQHKKNFSLVTSGNGYMVQNAKAFDYQIFNTKGALMQFGRGTACHEFGAALQSGLYVITIKPHNQPHGSYKVIKR